MSYASTHGRIGEELNSRELQHYSRHLLIPEIGKLGQRRLKGARVLLVGTGGLGSPASLYLAAAGVGTIGLVDFDSVDVTNLQRQILYSVHDVGKTKLECAAARLKSMNPHIEVRGHSGRVDSSNALELIRDYDLVIDGTDNFATRYLVNDACVLLGKPNVYASIFRFEGLLSVFNLDDGPCYRCLYPEPPPQGLVPSCAEAGVFGVLPGIMGALQAAEAIKLITGVGEPMSGRLLRFDAVEMKFHEFSIRRDPHCSVCGHEPTITRLIDYVSFCNGPAPADHGQAVELISTPQLAAQLTARRPLQLIDVRGSEEFSINHIQGARLLPLDEIESWAGELDRHTPIVCYCHSGVRSGRAVQQLIAKGFTNVASLSGGIIAWMEDEHVATH